MMMMMIGKVENTIGRCGLDCWCDNFEVGFIINVDFAETEFYMCDISYNGNGW